MRTSQPLGRELGEADAFLHLRDTSICSVRKRLLPLKRLRRKHQAEIPHVLKDGKALLRVIDFLITGPGKAMVEEIFHLLAVEIDS